MKEIKLQHPALFCEDYHNELVFIYGEEDGVRFNILPIDEEGEGCAGVLTDWEEGRDYSLEYKVTEIPTKLPA